MLICDNSPGRACAYMAVPWANKIIARPFNYILLVLMKASYVHVCECVCVCVCVCVNEGMCSLSMKCEYVC